MRSIDLTLPLNRLARMLTSYSVRTRIVVLALIPVAGFLANGLTYVSGEKDVGRAFGTVMQSNALADASRDFKSAVASMRIIVKDFSITPDNNLVVSFEQAHATRVGAEAMSRVAGASTDARSTASDVRDLADSVATEAEGLEAQVRQFLSNVQAA